MRLLVICFMMLMKDSNRYNEILVWDWQRQGMGINDDTWKAMGDKTLLSVRAGLRMGMSH